MQVVAGNKAQPRVTKVLGALADALLPVKKGSVKQHGQGQRLDGCHTSTRIRPVALLKGKQFNLSHVPVVQGLPLLESIQGYWFLPGSAKLQHSVGCMGTCWHGSHAS